MKYASVLHHYIVRSVHLLSVSHSYWRSLCFCPFCQNLRCRSTTLVLWHWIKQKRVQRLLHSGLGHRISNIKHIFSPAIFYISQARVLKNIHMHERIKTLLPNSYARKIKLELKNLCQNQKKERKKQKKETLINTRNSSFDHLRKNTALLVFLTHL